MGAACARCSRSARFWWIAPVARVRHGLVHGDPGAVGGAVDDGGRGPRRARTRRACLLAMSVVIAGGLPRASALFATRARAARHPRAAPVRRRASTLNLRRDRARSRCAFPATRCGGALYGFGAAANVLAFTLLNEGFPRELAGRANTAANLDDVRRQLRGAMGHRRDRRRRARARRHVGRRRACASRSLIVLAARPSPRSLWFFARLEALHDAGALVARRA